MRITYKSNNSGGNWWLKDKDWKNLEKAGWEVGWIKNDKFYKDLEKGGRWLGALAKEASKNFKSIKEAILEFEKITGQKVTDEGCNCCGPPHGFNWKTGKGGKDYNYCSGDGCSAYLYDKNLAGLSKRELLKTLTSN